jgi:hypothetical protein
LEILIHANMHQLQHFSTVLYLEGNLETKVFCDPITGLVRRIREIAVRANGMLLTLLIYIDNLYYHLPDHECVFNLFIAHPLF